MCDTFDKNNFCYFVHKDRFPKKKRKLIYVKNFTFEKRIISEIDKIIRKKTSLKFTNKNQIYESIYEFLGQGIDNYTVLKCDFKDFGNSVNINYVIDKFSICDYLDKNMQPYLQQYATIVSTCRGGIDLNSTLLEILAQEFDRVFKLYNDDILLYERFVDDLFVIFKGKLNVDEIKERLSCSINKVFFDEKIAHKNKTKMHFEEKFNCFTSNDLPKRIDFLGFSIIFDDKIKFDITERNKQKFRNQIKKFIINYKDNPQALKVAFDILSKGIVYKKVHNKKQKWIYKGFASKCRFLYRFDNFDISQIDYLGLIKNVYEELKIEVPKFLYYSKYDIRHNIIHNKFFVLEEKGGLPKDKLIKIMRTFGRNYDINTKYFDIAKDLLKIFKS